MWLLAMMKIRAREANRLVGLEAAQGCCRLSLAPV
jgi:hypothetical protein